MAIIGMLDDIQSTIGRLQSNGGLMGRIENAVREGNCLKLDVPIVLENRSAQTGLNVSGATGNGQRFPDTCFPVLPDGGAYEIRGLQLIGNKSGNGADLLVEFYNTTTSQVVASVTVPVASIPTAQELFSVNLPTPLVHPAGQGLDIRCLCPTGDGTNMVRLAYNLNAQPKTGSSYYISTTDSWSTVNTVVDDDFCFVLDIYEKHLSGSVTVPLQATAVQSWGQIFFSSEGDVTCSIEDEEQSVIVPSIMSGASIASLDPDKRLMAKFSLVRGTTADPTPILYEPSWTWTGAPPVLFSNKVQASGNALTSSVTILEIYGSGHCVLVCNGNSSSTYNTSFYIEIDDQPGFKINISDAVAAAPLFPLRFTHHLRITGTKNNDYTQAVATID